MTGGFCKLLCLTVALVLLSAMHGCSSEDAPPSPFSGALCSESDVDMGDVYAKTIQHTYVLNNNTEGIVEISKIGRSCACIEVDMSKSLLLPNETARLRIEIASPLRGNRARKQFHEKVLLHYNGSSAPGDVLTIKGTHCKTLYLQPSVLRIPYSALSDSLKEENVFLHTRGSDFEASGVSLIGCRLVSDVRIGKAERLPSGVSRHQVTLFFSYEDVDSLPYTERVAFVPSEDGVQPVELSVTFYDIRGEEVLVDIEEIAFGVIPQSAIGTKAFSVSWNSVDELELARVNCTVKGVRLTARAPHRIGDRTILAFDAETDHRISPGRIAGHAEIELSSPRDSRDIRKLLIPISGFKRR